MNYKLFSIEQIRAAFISANDSKPSLTDDDLIAELQKPKHEFATGEIAVDTSGDYDKYYIHNGVNLGARYYRKINTTEVPALGIAVEHITEGRLFLLPYIEGREDRSASPVEIATFNLLSAALDQIRAMGIKI